MSEDNLVDDGDVDDGERRAETSHHSPEQEAILEQRVEDRESAGVFLGVHVEQTAVQMLCFPRHKTEEDGQDTVGCATSAEWKVAGRVVAVVAIVAKVAVAYAVNYDYEAYEAESAHAGAVDEFVDDQLFGEYTSAKTVRRAYHDIRGS